MISGGNILQRKSVIVTDSSCNLSRENVDKYNIKVIPLRIITSEAEYLDGIDISSEEVYALMDKEVPKTSLPQPEYISNLYENIINEGYTDILHISISSGLSGTYNITNIVADSFRDKANIVIVDSKTLSGGLGLMCLRAAELLDSGKSIDEVANILIRQRKNMHGTFVIPTLEYLRKGGRVGLVEGVVGNLLNIKPVVYVNQNGVYETLAKARGFAKAKSLMLSTAIEKYKNVLVDAYIVHGMEKDIAIEFSEEVKSSLNVRNMFISILSPVLGVHTGKGLIGLILFPVEA